MEGEDGERPRRGEGFATEDDEGMDMDEWMDEWKVDR